MQDENINVIAYFMGNRYTLRGGEATLSKRIGLPSVKGPTLKGKNLLPSGAKAFLLEQTSFQKGLGVQESKKGVTKVPSLEKNRGDFTKAFDSP